MTMALVACISKDPLGEKLEADTCDASPRRSRKAEGRGMGDLLFFGWVVRTCGALVDVCGGNSCTGELLVLQNKNEAEVRRNA